MVPLKRLLLHRYWHRTGGMLGFAAVLGLVGGGAAAAFKASLLWMQETVLVRLAGFPGLAGDAPIPNYLFFLVPALGGLVSGLLVYTFAPEAAGAGTDALIDAYHNRGGRVRMRTAVVKFFASVVTLGTGGSAGQEGPMAQIGGGLGSWLGGLARLPDRQRRLLLLTGTSAGLGAIFHAPLGAALTSAEVVYKEDFESQGFLPFVVSAVVAFATFTLLTHEAGAYLHLPIFPFADPVELFAYSAVGLVCVPFSWAFVRIYHGAQSLFARLKVPDHVKPAIGGLAVGMLAYACPQVVGTDWSHLNTAAAGGFTFLALLVIAGAKIVATACTIGSGGSGGVFGPCLFIGGMVGGAVGYGIEAVAPGAVSHPGAFVLVGMGAFFAGAAKAPLAGMVMVCELTGSYGLLPPLLLATSLHLALSRGWSLYRSQRLNKFATPVHAHSHGADVLKRTSLASLSGSLQASEPLRPGWSLDEAQMHAGEGEIHAVVGEDGTLAGILPDSVLVRARAGGGEEIRVADVMDEPHALEASMNLQEALAAFLASGTSRLPMIGPDGMVIGMLGIHDILAEYGRLTRDADAAGPPAGDAFG